MSRYSQLFKTAAKGEEREAQEPAAKSFGVLFVDDEAGVLSAMRRIFMEENYRLFTAASGAEALAVMEENEVQLIVSDHRMPGMTGAELLKTVKERWPQVIRIMLTGHADVNSVMGAVKDGAVYKFITKPWNDDDLRLTVSLALQQYVLMQENQNLKELTRSQQQRIKNYASLFDENRGMAGNILVKAGAATREDLVRAAMERAQGELIIDALVRLGVVTEGEVVKALQAALNIDYVDLASAEIMPQAVRFLPRDLCERNRMVPIRMTGRQLTVAMADPSDIYKVDNISMMTGLAVVPLIATGSEILALLERAWGEGPALEQATDLEPIDEIDIIIDDEESQVSVTELIGSSEVPPVIRIVNAVISEAIRYHASDIHIEGKTKYTLVRFRIDGLLHSKIKIPADLHPAIVSRVKILAKMDISERRKPQDGRITVKAGTRIVDMRVSSMPTLNGEKLVLRILDKSAAIKDLPDLGVLPDGLQKIRTLVKKPQGVIIATGPTGSGKTTMLYSILSTMLEGSRNFETIEEPVEYFVEEANQVAVREKIGLSFANVLRATLRQDPDVILVGEIRDAETADVAFKAALTGHMVLSTLHTNSAVGSITRLIDMGVKPYIIASALEGLFAQRLVRRVCSACSTEVAPDREIMELLRVPPGYLDGAVRRGKGCDQCNKTGYRGRTGVFELFTMNEDFRHFISTSYKETELFDMARAGGMRTLLEDGLEKVRLGLTTLEELLRVLGPQLLHQRRCDCCNRMVDAKYLFCPFCGTLRRNLCRDCKLPLEPEWLNCPHCGAARE
ncbi:response regulator [Geomonas terrae]|uniref:Response regulator n=1 Tax=Geomonas terrae TaxID=2562681 RepID=A0A4S1CKW7_9BACT|nr:ATPase, T2SS/T4P/T4SS family [Geomonas terrae]TGU74367.1 response regulator [Geomonas terrae]